MALYENSRNTTDALIVEVVNQFTGLATRPAYIDLRYRTTDTSPDDRSFNVTDSEQWSNIGKRMLGDASSWWVIADLSGVVDPFEELDDANKVGVKKRLFTAPSKTRLYLEILSGEVPRR